MSDFRSLLRTCVNELADYLYQEFWQQTDRYEQTNKSAHASSSVAISKKRKHAESSSDEDDEEEEYVSSTPNVTSVQSRRSNLISRVASTPPKYTTNSNRKKSTLIINSPPNKTKHDESESEASEATHIRQEAMASYISQNQLADGSDVAPMEVDTETSQKENTRKQNQPSEPTSSFARGSTAAAKADTIIIPSSDDDEDESRIENDQIDEEEQAEEDNCLASQSTITTSQCEILDSQEFKSKDDFCSLCGTKGRLLVCNNCVHSYHELCIIVYRPTPDGPMLGSGPLPIKSNEEFQCKHLQRTCSTRKPVLQRAVSDKKSKSMHMANVNDKKRAPARTRSAFTTPKKKKQRIKYTG